MPSGHVDAVWFSGLSVVLALLLIGSVLGRRFRQRLRRQRGGAMVRRIADGYRAPRRNQTPATVRPVMPITPGQWAATVAPGFGSTPVMLGYGPGAGWEETANGPGLARRRGTQMYRDPYAGNVHIPHDPWSALYSSMASRGQRPLRGEQAD